MEICTWLVERPHILRLANQMLDAKKASPDFVPDIFSSDGTGPLSVRGSAVGSTGSSARESRRFLDGFSGCSTSSDNGNDGVRIYSHFFILILL